MSIYLIDYENVHESGLSGIKELPEGDRVIVFYGDKIKSISFDVHVQMMNSRAVVEFIETHKTAKNYLDFQLGTYLGYLIGRGSHDTVVIVSHDTGFDSVVDFWKERGTDICRRDLISETKTAAPASVQEKTGTKNTGSSQKQKKNTAQKAKASPEEQKKTRPAPEPVKPALDLATEESIQIKPDTPAASENSGKEKADKTQNEKQETQKKPDLPETYRKKVRAALRSDKLSSGNYTTIYRAISGSKDKLSLNNTLVKAYGSEKGGEVYNRIKDIFAEYQASISVQH